MNRMEEYQAMLEELDRSVPALEGTLDRAWKKKRKRTAKMVLRPAAGLAACFVVFVLLVNFSAPVAYACSRIPILKELAEAVTFSRSLRDAVENEYVQPMELSQTENDITAEIAYLIVDQKQVNVFYRLLSDQYSDLAATPRVYLADGERPASCSYHTNGYGVENGELCCLSIDFMESDVPASLTVKFSVYSNNTDPHTAPQNTIQDMGTGASFGEPAYLAEFEFLLEFDPQFTATGKIIPVNQTVMLDGQAITVTEVEVYPTHMRVVIAESADNTAWLKGLDFYIETDMGIRFEPGASGILSTGSTDSPSMVSYRAESTYFYEAEHLKLVITGAEWLRKDLQTTYLNLVTGEHGELPQGAAFDSAERSAGGWVLRFRADWDESEPMYQLFGSTYYDAEGNAYEINQWSSLFGEADETGAVTFFYDEFPLLNYPYDEVWLEPIYSHRWTAGDLLVIPIQ